MNTKTYQTILAGYDAEIKELEAKLSSATDEEREGLNEKIERKNSSFLKMNEQMKASIERDKVFSRDSRGAAAGDDEQAPGNKKSSNLSPYDEPYARKHSGIEVGKDKLEKAQDGLDMGEFIAGVYAEGVGELGSASDRYKDHRKHSRRIMEKAVERKQSADFTAKDITGGGAFIPKPMENRLLELEQAQSVVFGGPGYPGVTTIPMTSRTVEIPTVVETDRSGVGAKYLGGIVVYREGEAESRTATRIKTGKIELKLKRMTAYAVVPDTLSMFSSVSMVPILERAFATALAGETEFDIMQGAGAQGAQGLTAAQAKISVTRATNDEINKADTDGMRSRVCPELYGEYVWLASFDTYTQLSTMPLIAGTPAAGLAMVPFGGGVQPIAQLGFNSLHMRPLVFSSRMKAIANSAGDDIMLVHLPSYIRGVAAGVGDGVFEHSIHLKFDKAETAYRIQRWQDGMSWLPSAITARNASTVTQSTIIGLAD